MSGGHLVARAVDARYTVPPRYAGRAIGHRRWSVVDESTPAAVHTGFGLCELDPGGAVPAHLHSYEQSSYLLAGAAILETPDGATRLVPGDYALVPVGVPHSWRNDGPEVARWADLAAPQPRERHDEDTVFVAPLPATEPRPVDPRDPRTRRFGHIDASNMDVGRQSQEHLAVSASMRTALLVYSGISVKMMIDSDLGAQLSTMFMVHYDPDGTAGAHDHPFEETYLILDGATEATFDGQRYLLEPGDVAWAGVGCVHSFAAAGNASVRWLETQAPAPPPRHSYRFERDWTYLRTALGAEDTGEQ